MQQQQQKKWSIGLRTINQTFSFANSSICEKFLFGREKKREKESRERDLKLFKFNITFVNLKNVYAVE